MTNKEAIELFKDIEVLVFCDVKQKYFHEDIEEAFKMAIEALETTPHGKWIKKNVSPYTPYRCSVCGGAGCSWYNFCQKCGADMRRKKND